jgi:polyhydroxybutyrate depolymerase
MRRTWFIGALMMLVLGAGCSSSKGSSDTTAASATSVQTTALATTVPASAATTAAATAATGARTCTTTSFGGERPVTLHVPGSYACGTPAPLVIVLHGFTDSGDSILKYFGMTAESDKRGFLLAAPEGTKDNRGFSFWNATDACCNFNSLPTDDSAYLSALITDIQAAYDVDPKRVYVMGHSNGGFMSYRMACEHSDQIAAIASLAGAMWSDTTRCSPTQPVSVLQVHGTSDSTIAYTGGQIELADYPPASISVKDWVGFDGCNPYGDESTAPLDLDSGLTGAETQITGYSGCEDGSSVQLWAIQGASTRRSSPLRSPRR